MAVRCNDFACNQSSALTRTTGRNPWGDMRQIRASPSVRRIGRRSTPKKQSLNQNEYKSVRTSMHRTGYLKNGWRFSLWYWRSFRDV